MMPTYEGLAAIAAGFGVAEASRSYRSDALDGAKSGDQ